MSVSEDIRALARDGLNTAEIARRLGIRYQHAYNVLKADSAGGVASQATHPSAGLDLKDALVLVSCVSQKRSEPTSARLLYCSEWFNKARALVEAQEANWFVLSALYGVVAPNTRIAPYEKTLNTFGVDERRSWARNVHRQLLLLLEGQKRVVIFAGQRYREFLAPALVRDGFAVDVPMANLRIGEQLAWLAART